VQPGIRAIVTTRTRFIVPLPEGALHNNSKLSVLLIIVDRKRSKK
jgi:hypothetical protein